MAWLRRQFMRPTGWGGRLAGRVMAFKNAAINRKAVEVLDPGLGSRVLEIGFGPGVAIAELLKRADRVAGIDHSETMVKAAARRNREAIRVGRLELVYGSADQLPWKAGAFTHALMVNCLYAWSDGSAEVLKGVQRVLDVDGQIVIGVRMTTGADGMRSPGAGIDAIAGIEAGLQRTGYEEVSVSHHAVGSREMAAIRAWRPTCIREEGPEKASDTNNQTEMKGHVGSTL